MKFGVVFLFVYGFNVYFNFIVLCVDIDVLMVVLKGFGYMVCSEYLCGGGVLCFFVIY